MPVFAVSHVWRCVSLRGHRQWSMVKISDGLECQVDFVEFMQSHTDTLCLYLLNRPTPLGIMDPAQTQPFRLVLTVLGVSTMMKTQRFTSL